jgi:hypothetical protein
MQDIVSYTKSSAMQRTAEQLSHTHTFETTPHTGIPGIRAALQSKFDSVPFLTTDQLHAKHQFARTESLLDAQNRLVQVGDGIVYECIEDQYTNVLTATLARLISLFDSLPLTPGSTFYCDVVDDQGRYVQRGDLALSSAIEVAKFLSAIDPTTCTASAHIADLLVPSKTDVAALTASDSVKRELLQQVKVPHNQSHYRIQVIIH